MTDFSGMNIITAENGFMVESNYGGVRRVFPSFYAAAEYYREPIPAPAAQDAPTYYTSGHNKDTIREVISLYRSGEKINAIKLMRDIYGTRLGLREAKELVELLAEY